MAEVSKCFFEAIVPFYIIIFLLNSWILFGVLPDNFVYECQYKLDRSRLICKCQNKPWEPRSFSPLSFIFHSVFFTLTHFVFFLISSTSCLMWSSMNSIFSFLRACAFCSRTIRSTSTALSTSGKLSTTTTDEPDWFSGERSSILLPRAFREPESERFKPLCSSSHTIRSRYTSINNTGRQLSTKIRGIRWVQNKLS